MSEVARTTEYSRVSGDPVLDLINTLQWRLDPGASIDALTSFEDAVQWAQGAGLVAPDEAQQFLVFARERPEVADVERLRIVQVRESFYHLLFGNGEYSARMISRLYREALSGAILNFSDWRWGWVDEDLSIEVLRHRIVRGVVAFTQRDDLDHLYQCEDERCGRVFLDFSPRRNRRWCVAKECGDRNRSRAYYSRRKALEQR
ncbi:CGNR zinc finger domain-containing protein [Luteococcus sp. Sow4_B9]|uniref:CGNR zinc finger domain-containing protein n=1 Tax=Luteococcus sp. Sow4_B9 TaxID=3438792 RepID=UPI003F990222